MAFADAFDIAFIIKCELQTMSGKKTELSMITDSLSLFNVSTKATMTTGKQLMIGLKTAKKFY